MVIDFKQCRKCLRHKSLDNFWHCEGTSDGLHYDCNSCMQAHWVAKLEANRLKSEKLNKKDTNRVTVRALMRSAKKRAKRDGIPFSITDRDIELVHICPIRGVKMVRNQGKISPDNYSLDRRDNSKGYEPGNVFILSWMANQSKNNLTVEQVERLLAYMKGTL